MLDSKLSLWALILGVGRRIRGWTGQQLAAEAGVSYQTISRYEKSAGVEEPTYETVRELFGVMGHPAAAVDALAAALELIFSPFPRAGDSWFLTAAHLTELRKIAVMSGAGWTREAEDWLVIVVEQALEARDRQEAAAACESLRRLPPEERRERVETAPELHTWAVCVTLCDWSERAASIQPRQALAWAELALAAAHRAPEPEARRFRLLGYATAFKANALRVASRLREADAAFAEAWRLWEAGADASAGPLLQWRLLDLEASLGRDNRQFDRALTLLSRALEAAPLEEHGRILVKKGSTLEQLGEVEAAVATLQAAQSPVDEAGEPRLQCYLRFNLATCLCHLERWSEAEILLREVRSLAFEHDVKGFDWLRIHWLSAKVHAGQGRHAEAIEELRAVRNEFAAQGNEGQTALVSLELSVVYLEAGKTREVRELARQMAPLFERVGILREALAAFRVFQQSVELETTTVELARRLLACVLKVNRQPDSERERPSGAQEPLLGSGGARVSVDASGRYATAAGVHGATEVQGRNLPPRRAQAAGVHGAPCAQSGPSGRAQAARVEGAPEIQPDRRQKPGHEAQRIPRSRGGHGAGGGERSRGEQDQPEREGRQGASGTSDRSRHRKAPFEAAAPEPAWPADAPLLHRLPLPAKNSTTRANIPEDPSAAPLTESALLARWLREIPGSQLALAALAGIDSSALSRHETGRAVPQRRTFERLLAGLRLPLALVENGLRPLARTIVALLGGHGPWRPVPGPPPPATLGARHARLLETALSSFLTELGLARRRPEEAARATLELALLHLEEGKTIEARALAETLVELFEQEAAASPARAAVEVFAQAARAEAATPELARSLLDHLRTLAAQAATTGRAG